MIHQDDQGEKRTGGGVGMNLQRVKISEVAEVNPRLRSKPKQDELVSFVPMAAVSEKTVSIESPVDRPFAEVAKGFTPFERGDVIVAKITPCFENGKMAHAVDLPRAIGVGSTEFHVLRPKPSLNGAYLFHMLRLPAVRLDGARKMQGAAGQRRVPADFFASLQIPLPPLAEQKRIAAILDAADALRTKRREALAQLDALLQSTFLTLFGDPVTNPMGWERKTLGEIINFIGGSQPPKETFTYEPGPGKIRLVQIRDFKSDKFQTYIPEKLARRPFKEDDVMIARYGPPVFQILRGLSGSYNVALMKAEPIGPVEKLFIFHLLSQPKINAAVVAKSERTAGQTGVNLQFLNNYPAYLPPLPLQQKFAAIVESVERQKATQRAHLAELDALFAALQHRAFRGEL
jgi:type I restriction enzyme S subunit